MANKIIITVCDDTPDIKAVACVAAVIKQGRISAEGRSYCYVAEFEDGTVVSADRATKSDTFKVWQGRVVDERA